MTDRKRSGIDSRLPGQWSILAPLCKSSRATFDEDGSVSPSSTEYGVDREKMFWDLLDGEYPSMMEYTMDLVDCLCSDPGVMKLVSVMLDGTLGLKQWQIYNVA